MYKGPATGIIWLLISCSATGAANAADRWVVFSSPIGFEISYPAAWHLYKSRVGQSFLEITATPQAPPANGVYVIPGRAVITAGSANFDELSQHLRSSSGNRLISRRQLPKSAAPECDSAEEVVSKYQQGPGAGDVPPSYSVDTYLFCRKGSDAYAVLLQAWEGDREQARWRAVARRMLKSLKIRN